MSPRKPTTPDVTPPDQIVDIDVSKEMQGSFLEYAYSVIYARALPDARDGLKPVQRRILFQMGEMGLRPDRGHVKSSRVVGDVMGKLHPHGDTAIYDAMVRMAQPFALRLPLVDGHGNFGSLDDGPAAPRYTETRLSAAAMTLIEDLDEDVVDLVPNYDNTQLQPEVLPAAYPNLLVNGAQGIAVGMATNMAPHNLVEVIAAARHLIAHSEASLEELERFVPGPDLPTGGIVIGLDGIRDAYRTGRGSFKTRAKVHVENVTARTKGLVVTELPYMVGPERVIEKIKDGVKANKLRGIRDVLNLTDRHNGLRLVVEVKNGFNPEAVLAQLYKHTPMEDSFGMNNVALVDGRPRTLGLRELLEVFVDHRLDVVRRRTEFRLARRRERLHLVDGLLLAIADIDEVIAVIRSSDDADAARTRLMQIFDLSEAQANYILELRLRRLTKFSRIELEAEREDLARQIAELEAILGSGARLREVVSGELQEVADTHGTPRRTVLLDEAGAAGLAGVGVAGGKAGVAGNAQGADGAIPLEVPDTPCWVILSATGRLARTGDDTEPVRSGPRQSHDAVVGVVPATARGEVGLVTNRGNLVRLGVVNTPALAPTAGAPGLAGGQKVEELAHLEKGERVVGLMDLRAEANPLALATAHGVVKRVKAEDLGARENLEVITLAPGDEVVAAWHCADTDVLALVSSDAQLLRFGADAVRPQGRAGRGIAGMKLAAGARVIALGVVDGDDLAGAHVVTIAASSGALPSADPGSAKVTPLDRYPAKGRATGGVRTHRFVRGQDELRLAWVGVAPARAVTAGGRPVAPPEADERRDGSGQALTTAVAAIG